MKKFYFLFPVFIGIASLLQAQERTENPQPWVDPHNRNGNELILDGSYDIEELILDIFEGSCVTPFNIQFQGSLAGLGYFEAAQTNLGVPAGIFIASGNIENAIGPNNEASAGNGFGLPGHPDLNVLSGQPTFDAAVIEFEFTSEEPDLHFRYVFGSEEYPEYVCASFNDVFGFFVSGPGLQGPFSNFGANVALIPNTSTGVAINTVNQGAPGSFGNPVNCGPDGLDYSQFYVDNTGSSTLQYDGFTTPFDAKFTVIPGQVYKAVIAVADAGDGIFDSGVFISVESLCGDSLFTPIASLKTTYLDKNTVTLSGDAKYAYNEWAYHYKNGEVTVTKDPITIQYDVPGIHEVFFTATNYCCTDTLREYIYINLAPHIANALILPPTCFNSVDGRIELDVRTSVGGLSYLWSDGSQVGPIRENLPSGLYKVTITDAEGKETVSNEFDLRVDPLVLNIQNKKILKSPAKPVIVEATGGHAPYTFIWSDGAHGPQRNNLISGQPYQVQVLDARGCSELVGFTYNGEIQNVPPDIIIIPNPAGASLRYQIVQGALVVEGGMLRVTNTFGQMIHEEKIQQQQFKDLDVSRWPEGLYLFHFENEQDRTTQKVFIRR